MWAARVMILLTKVLAATYIHETLLTNPWAPWKIIFSDHFKGIGIEGQITPCPCWMLGEVGMRKLEASCASNFYVISFALTLFSLCNIILIFSGAPYVLTEAFLKGHQWVLKSLCGCPKQWWVVGQPCLRRADHSESKTPYCNKGGEKNHRTGTSVIFLGEISCVNYNNNIMSFLSLLQIRAYGATAWHCSLVKVSGQYWNWLKTREMLFPFCSLLKCLNHFLLEWNKVLACFISPSLLAFFLKLKCWTQALLKTSLKGLSNFLFTPNTFFSRHNFYGDGSSCWLCSSYSCVSC